jgi:uncharacterized protein with GYD domain
MREGGTKRCDAVIEALKSVDGSMDCFYYAFRDADVLGVFDIPEPADAAALSLMINSKGAVTLRLKPLMSPEDLDAASKRTPSYGVHHGRMVASATKLMYRPADRTKTCSTARG